ncbi:MAG: response regulator transcription factor [Phaeodactylibacter sp.]|nr:response regulator transcription factor [Phaeodactylibacter sp.]
MQKIRCLIVEDEPIAAEILEDYIRQVPFLELVEVCTDAIYALQALQREPIDLIFLDIHLPKLKGLDFLRALDKPPSVILTTAYHQYALEGYDLNVVDYLLKPIEFSRFLKAVQKVQPPRPAAPEQKEPQERPFRFFNVNKRMEKIYLDEVAYVESLKEYVRIITREKEIVTKFQIGELEKELGMNNLLRIHRSFLVAKDKITAYTATEVEVGGKRLPIGRTYREEVARELEGL